MVPRRGRRSRCDVVVEEFCDGFEDFEAYPGVALEESVDTDEHRRSCSREGKCV